MTNCYEKDNISRSNDEEVAQVFVSYQLLSRQPRAWAFDMIQIRRRKSDVDIEIKFNGRTEVQNSSMNTTEQYYWANEINLKDRGSLTVVSKIFMLR